LENGQGKPPPLRWPSQVEKLNKHHLYPEHQQQLGLREVEVFKVSFQQSWKSSGIVSNSKAHVFLTIPPTVLT
jgi:hypothetical protein